MLVLSQRDIVALLRMEDCIEVMAGALGALARGESMVPLRTMMRLPRRRGARVDGAAGVGKDSNAQDIFALMPAYTASPAAIGAKIITVFPGNHGTRFDSHQGAVLLFDAEHGTLQALMDATSITSIRTAAVSALSTRLLAREDADDLAILGSGVQARMHLDAIPIVRNIRRIRVWSRNRSNAEMLSSARHGGVPVEVCDTAEDAVRDAAIVCATTSATEPVLKGDWVADGAHVVAVGSATPRAREVDTGLVKRSRVFVDSRVSALQEPGDILIPLEEGEITPDHIVAELGELVVRQRQGRRSAREITFFKSLGLAVEDLASAQFIYAQALERGIGVAIDLGGARDAS